jgi:hypothetical protein
MTAEEILKRFQEWADMELSEGFRKRLNSYSYGESAFEDAQNDVREIIQEILSEKNS